MLITNRTNTRFGIYDGFSTNLLIGEINSGSKEISIQITDVEPKRMQFLHSHKQEQCYYIISGTGLMIIDDHTREVREGDAVFIPENATHGIKNTGSDTLTYLTANQAFGKRREEEIWSEENVF
ncbi:MAG: cupin domain-containing protein [Syntrophaceae bacterium]